MYNTSQETSTTETKFQHQCILSYHPVRSPLYSKLYMITALPLGLCLFQDASTFAAGTVMITLGFFLDARVARLKVGQCFHGFFSPPLPSSALFTLM